jgi:hypothetical protein
MLFDEEEGFQTQSAHADLSQDNMSTNRNATQTELLNMTPKIPPAFNGTYSWFQFEERVDEWCDITTLTPRRRGPMLKSRLCGLAEKYKPFLDRELLTDPITGVSYFKNTMREFFIKGSEHTFLWRFLSFMQKTLRRPQTEFIEWIARFETNLKRLREAWMDLFQS